MRLIDAEALGIGACNLDVFENKGYAAGWNSAIKIIEAAPTVDTAPLQHGEWKATDAYMTDECSICGTRINIEEFDEAAFHPMYGRVPLNYCPNCGAKMDGKVRS